MKRATPRSQLSVANNTMWVERAYFTINDEIRRKPDGEFYAVVEPEDWFFSRKARELGATLFATREIAASHFGANNFNNTSPWGELEKDSGGQMSMDDYTYQRPVDVRPTTRLAPSSVSQSPSPVVSTPATPKP